MEAMENFTEGLTLETLPKAFTQLTNEVSEIKRLLLEKSNGQPTEADRWFDLNELCLYHPDKPTKPTVYGWVNAGKIPVHKGGKKLRFLKSEIDAWLKLGRKKTFAEASNEAENYISSKKRKCEFEVAAESIVNNIFKPKNKKGGRNA